MGAEQPFTVDTKVGMLVEARVFSLRTRADVEEYGRACRDHLRALATPVLCADHRPVAVYPQEVTDRLVELFIDNNSRVERVAIVVAPSNATLVLQLDRLVREAGFQKRKRFQSPEPALSFLAEALTPAELERARAFLAEYPKP